MSYLVQNEDWTLAKGYGFQSFAKGMGKNIGKNISKDLYDKYHQKLFDYSKKSAADALKTSSKRVIKNNAEATGHLIGKKIANKIAKVSKIRNKIIQRHLQMRMIKKYLKEDIYLKKKGKKLLMN